MSAGAQARAATRTDLMLFEIVERERGGGVSASGQIADRAVAINCEAKCLC